jgi:hypothetical protein
VRRCGHLDDVRHAPNRALWEQELVREGGVRNIGPVNLSLGVDRLEEDREVPRVRSQEILRLQRVPAALIGRVEITI